MSVFNHGDIADIERLAFGLSQTEVLDAFCVLKEELSQDDLDLFTRAYKKGRALGKAKAVDKLFGQMDRGQGVAGALAYLTRMGEEWPQEEANKGGKGAFSFEFDLTEGS